MQIWLNGKWVPESQASIPLFDRSYLYGEGVFETLRVYRGRPAFLERHFGRLRKNCERLQIPLPFSLEDLNQAIADLLQANHLAEAVVRITCSTVGATFGVDRPKAPKTNCSIFCRPVELDPKLFQTGVKILPLPSLRNDDPNIAQIKSTSYLTKMLARAAAAKAGAYESLLKNSQGFWVEGSRTNFFIVVQGEVLTPPLSDGLLGGITREVVLEILTDEKIPHRETHLSEALLQRADEIFLTGTTSEVMPVCEVMGIWKKSIPPQGWSQQLLQAYRKRIA